jgi:hypothetical protein
VEFSTSGLENPLTTFLLAVFFVVYQRRGQQAAPIPQAADPGRCREGPEQDLLAERGNDDASQQRQGEADWIARRG